MFTIKELFTQSLCWAFAATAMHPSTMVMMTFFLRL